MPVVKVADVSEITLAGLRPEVLETLTMQRPSVQEAREEFKAAHSDEVGEEKLLLFV